MWLQNGIFDSKAGEYFWKYKVGEKGLGVPLDLEISNLCLFAKARLRCGQESANPVGRAIRFQEILWHPNHPTSQDTLNRRLNRE